jgi:hypothetical protein
MTHKHLIEAYIEGWLTRDKVKIVNTLSPDIEIIESHGPVYRGIKKVEAWVDSWIAEGNAITDWHITSYYTIEDTVFFEWSFECVVKGELHALDGMSIVKFTDNKISYIREYKTTKPLFEASFPNE